MEDFTLPSIGARFKNQRGNFQRAIFKPPYPYYPPFWADVVNSSWLAIALTCHAHTFSKSFIFP